MCRKTQYVKTDVEMFAEEPVPQYIHNLEQFNQDLWERRDKLNKEPFKKEQNRYYYCEEVMILFEVLEKRNE